MWGLGPRIQLGRARAFWLRVAVAILAHTPLVRKSQSGGQGSSPGISKTPPAKDLLKH